MDVTINNPITGDSQQVNGVRSVVFHCKDGKKTFTDHRLFDITDYTSVSLVISTGEKVFTSDYRISKLS